MVAPARQQVQQQRRRLFLQLPGVSVVNNCGNSVLTATGASGATFLWSNGDPGNSIMVTTNGTYTVRQTVNGCTSLDGSGTTAINQVPSLTGGLTGQCHQ